MELFETIKQQMMDEYSALRPKSYEWRGRATRVLPGGDTRTITWFEPYPSFIEYGRGCRMWDVDGNEIYDFQNNYTSLIHGHAFPPVVEAIQKQIARGSIFTAPLESQVVLAEMICERAPSIDMLRFTNSGTEATMHAVRAARAYTGRTKIVKVEGGYHGSSDIFEASVEPDISKAGAIDAPVAVAGSKGVPKQALEQVIVVPLNESEITRRLIESQKNDIAAFILEPVQGSAGQIEPDPDYLTFVRDITTRLGIVLIFDEVVTFRMSVGGAQEYYGVTPDMTTLGKIIGGGTPLGAFGGKREIMELYDPSRHLMSHSGTFNGNALGMVGGAAVLNHLSGTDIDRLNALGERLRRGIRRAAANAGLNIRVNGVASLINVVFSNHRITEYRGLARSHEKFNELLSLGLINRNIFIAPRGMMCLSTPMKEEDTDYLADKIEEVFLQIRPAIEESAPDLLL